MKTILKICDINFSYDANPVLKSVSLSISAGTVTGIIGPNGAGKSTLMRIMAGLLKPNSGSVILGDKPIDNISPTERARQIAMVPQESNFPFSFTALEIVLMGRAPYLPKFGFESRHDIDIATHAMKDMDCSSLASRDINELSGGERRRVVIARALAQEPAILLLDEPTSFLDLRHSSELAILLKKQVKSSGLSVVAVMHDLNLAASFCDNIIILKDGLIAAQGPPSKVISADVIRSAFGVNVRTGIDAASGSLYCVPV